MKPIVHFLNTDAKLLDALRKGDEKALAMLYESSRRMVTAFVKRNHGTETDAEDLLQEAVIILWERVRWETFVYESKLSTFLVGVVKNLLHARRRKRSREVPIGPDDPEFPDSDPLPDDLLMESEERGMVERGMERLGGPCRQLLLLYYWEERTTAEIAQLMGLANADTVKSKKYQCKKALESILKAMTE